MSNGEQIAPRILAVDDEEGVIEAYQIAFGGSEAHEIPQLSELKDALFGCTTATPNDEEFDLHCYHQGDEAVEAVRQSVKTRHRFSVALIDMRMPPGIDGVTTAEQIREIDPDINIVIVTGFSDITPSQISERVPPIDKLLYCQKPVQAVELTQLAHSLTAKWAAERSLEATSERLHHLLSSSPAVIYSCDPLGKGAPTFVSENVKTHFGYEPQDFLADPAFWLSKVHPDDVIDAAAKLRHFDGRSESIVEYRFLHKENTYRWISDRARLVLDGNGKPLELVGTWVDITERKEHQEQLQHQALHDALTGLPNRALLMDRLTHSLKVAERDQKPLALLILDLDRFKEINDTLGHDVGDALLCDIAQRMSKELRQSDTIARLGGDEFAALLPAVSDLERAERVVKRIRGALEAPFQVEDLSLDIGFSIGIALYPEHAEQASRLLQCAEVAMYKAKDGSSPSALYDHADDPNSVRQLTISGELRRALETDQLSFHYQPKFDLETQALCGVEALARWQHPTHGFVPPNEFIPLAERSGLIQPFLRWSLESALSQVAKWRSDGFDIGVSVNLSARNLHEKALPDLVETILAANGIPPERLTLELTESAIMVDPTGALEIINRLDKIGVHLSIDDFGTGYSSFAYLTRLPVDELKIDKSFVMKMTESRNDLLIVRATIELAHNLGLKVVAEGIESEEHRVLLRDLSCDIGQGFGLSKPLPVSKLNEQLNSQHFKLVDEQDPTAEAAGRIAS